jgi:hypothetical protein
MTLSLRERQRSRLAELRRVRSPWEGEWRDNADQLSPFRQRWFRRDRNATWRHSNDHIINNTPVLAVRVLASGMMAGITSPSRKWFKLTTADPALADAWAVKEYLALVEDRVRWVLARSNWYSALADGVYRDLGVIGTAALLSDEDPLTGVWFRSLPVGEWYLDVSAKGEIDTLYRELSMTVRQLVQQFGYDACSRQVRNAWDRSTYGQSFDVIHVVQPNEEYDSGRAGRVGQRFSSCWFEETSPEDKYLRESGYEEFPALCPRWNVLESDVYGRGPAWDARGDAKALQHLEKRLAALVDKSASPPMKGSPDIQRASLIPGDLVRLPRGASDVYEPAMVVQPAAIQAVFEHIKRHEGRIDRTYFVDLWLRILRDERQQPATATEIEEGKQESMLQLGPLLENLDGSLLRPAVKRTVAILARRGWLPPPPPELLGALPEIEFISIMHQMQKMTGIGGVRLVVDETMRLAQAGRPDALDKLDPDAIIDEIAEMAGVKPQILLSSDEVAKIRKARAQRQQAAEQGQAILAATQGARNLGQVNTQNLQDLAQAVSPAAAAQGGALADMGAAA